MTSYRVAQWATGNIGTRSLRGVIDHPSLELVAVYVHDPAKAGRDAGELCDRPVTGVLTTNDIDDVIAAAPDCVLYMPRALDAEDVCRLLAAGSNVVSTRGEFHHPTTMDPALRELVEDACATGNTSIHSTGSSPGFITEALPIVVTSLQRRLDLLSIEEFADLSQRPSPGLLFEVMGFGRPPAEISPARLEHGLTSFGPSLQQLAAALGVKTDRLAARGAVAVANQRTEIAAGVLEAGTVAAQRTTVEAFRDDAPIVRFNATWYCTKDIDADWDLGDTGWRVQVYGDAPLDIDLRFPVPLERMAELSPGYTANRAVNAVPVVCEAPPGIRTTVELPHIVAQLA